MSPALPREERDAIRARHLAWHNSDPSDATWPDDLAAVIVDAQSQSPRRAAVQAAMAHEIVREDVPALLDALDATEEEARWLREVKDRVTFEMDAARAEVAALREAHVSAADIARASERSLEYHEGFAAGVAALAQAQDDALRALAADEGDRPESPKHRKGANAEDCPACANTNPPYPFICPGDDRWFDKARIAAEAREGGKALRRGKPSSFGPLAADEGERTGR